MCKVLNKIKGYRIINRKDFKLLIIEMDRETLIYTYKIWLNMEDKVLTRLYIQQYMDFKTLHQILNNKIKIGQHNANKPLYNLVQITLK